MMESQKTQVCMLCWNHLREDLLTSERDCVFLPVDHQLVLAGETGGADGAVVLLLVVEVLVLLSRLLRKEVLLAPGVTTPPQIVLEEEVSSAVGEDHVTDVTVVLLVGVAGADHHAVLLGDL